MFKCIFAPQNFTMNSSEKSEAFYNKLRTQLQDTTLWPTTYLYKFIILSDDAQIKKLSNIFNNLGAVINTTLSKNGKYTSISVNVKMQNPDAVIAKYKEVAEKIDGVISL